MRSVKLLTDIAGNSAGIADRWYVSDGAKAIGPIGLDLIARGVEAGKVPIGSYVRHEAWRVWRPLTELAEVSVDSSIPTPRYQPAALETIPGLSTLNALSALSAGNAKATVTDDVTMPGRPVFPDEVIPSDALAGAADLDDALLLLMNAAILRAHADAAILHVVRPEGATVLYAHGPFARTVVGEVTSLVDPLMAAATQGHILIAEPTPGPAGRLLIERLLHVGVACEAATMFPIHIHNRLAATLDLGRVAPRFRPSELGAVEALLDALLHHAESDHWSA